MFKIFPYDRNNKKLQEFVAPLDWINPVPAGIYDLAVIGAGTAGLVTAAGASSLGARVALIEKKLMGGDCLNYGCVPSKVLIEASRKVYAITNGSKKFGIPGINMVKIDFGAVMERMREIRARISINDSAERFKGLGVDVFFGRGMFVDKKTVDVEGKKIKFNKAVIATGTSPFIPMIENIESTGFLTNETIFNLTKRPERLIIIGAGPIGCELAQAFNRLGVKISLLHDMTRILDREDEDASLILQEKFIDEGIDIYLNTRIINSEKKGNRKTIFFEVGGKLKSITADDLLICTGRKPDIYGMNLESAGVNYDERKGIIVNDKLQTSNKKIYAAGDVCFPYRFTHVADFLARIVIQNALFAGNKKASDLVIPWATYTSPEIAHVGMYEKEAIKKGIKIDSFKIEFSEIDRAVVGDNNEGFIKIFVRKGTDTILGATIAAPEAGELINEITVAMAHKIGLSGLSGVIHPYPTISEGIRKTGDKYNRTRLTAFTKKVLKLFIKIFGK